MADYGQFFIRRDVLEGLPIISNEQDMGKLYDNVDFEDASNMKNVLKIPGLQLKITTHKIILTHPKNTQIAFYTNIEKITNIKEKNGGLFGFGGLNHINLYVQNGKLRLKSKSSSDMQKMLNEIKLSRDKQTWKIKPIENTSSSQGGRPQMYTGYKSVFETQKQEIKNNETKFQTSFQKGGIDSLMKHAQELKELTQFIKENSSIYSDNTSEVDNILEGIGYFNIITKDEAGKNYTQQLAQQIYTEICGTLFQIYGDIVPLLDVFYFYNKKRGGINIISASEFYEACSQFDKMPNIEAKISVYEGNKVIESTKYNAETDFEQDIGKFIGNQGVTAEQLSKLLTKELAEDKTKAQKGQISILIARIKLNRALKAGKVVIDDRIEGAKYFKNCIMFGF